MVRPEAAGLRYEGAALANTPQPPEGVGKDPPRSWRERRRRLRARTSALSAGVRALNPWLGLTAAVLVILREIWP